MDDRGPRIIVNSPSRLLDAIAPVDIFPIHKERLVQPANLLNRLAAYQHERTDQTVHRILDVRIQIPQLILVKLRLVRKQLAEPKSIIEGR